MDQSADQQASRDGEAYSPRLGRIAPARFQSALDRFGLGRFVAAAPIRGGNFGQVLFLTSTTGEWVLRGAPLYPSQFREERFFAELLHDRTRIPGPWPYLLDEAADIFGWPYVLMPRLPGLDLEEPSVTAGLTTADRLSIARALGATLAAMQEPTWNEAAAYDDQARALRPLADGHAAFVLGRLRRALAQSREHAPHVTTAADARWVEELVAAGEAALAVPFAPCLVMRDFKDQNATVARVSGDWRVTGVFDLMGLYIGDGEVALCRQIAREVGRDPEGGPALAEAFVRAYTTLRTSRPGFTERLVVYLLEERLAVWEWAQRERTRWWPAELSLRDWAEPLVTLPHGWPTPSSYLLNARQRE